jgi:hypothetical protein
MDKHHFTIGSGDSEVSEVDCLVRTFLRAKKENGEFVYPTEEDKAAFRGVHITVVDDVEFFIRRMDGTVHYFLTNARDILKLADAIREFQKHEEVTDIN